MKLLRIVPFVLVLVAGVAFADGSGSGSPPPPSGATISDADVQRFLAFWDKLVDTVVADKDTCPKMATDINALVDANKDIIAMAQKARESGKHLPPDAVQHIADGAKRMAGAMMNCVNDAGVKSALQRLPRQQRN